MTVYAGIDLHSNNSVVAVMDGEGGILFERRRPNDLARIVSDLEPYREDLAGVAVESTYNWYWLVDGLMDHDFPVRLVHTPAVAQYAGLKHGNDFSDAWHLAQLMRLGLLPEGYIYPREQRATRDLLRRRFSLVRQAVQLALSIQSSYSRTTGQRLSVNALRRTSPAQIVDLFPDPTTRYGVMLQLKAWLTLQDQIQSMEKWVRTDLANPGDLVRVRSVPGIGLLLGMTILLETGTIKRFASVGDYASYCRMVESVRFSNGKTKGHGNRKCGNRYLCWAYMEAANFAIRYDARIQRWHARKQARKHKIVAIKAVAHKLARACYYMLREGTDFDVTRAFG